MAKEPKIKVGEQIKSALYKLSNTDGLKRTQRWLSIKIGMSETILSNKIRMNDFTQEELEKINSILMCNIE